MHFLSDRIITLWSDYAPYIEMFDWRRQEVRWKKALLSPRWRKCQDSGCAPVVSCFILKFYPCVRVFLLPAICVPLWRTPCCHVLRCLPALPRDMFLFFYIYLFINFLVVFVFLLCISETFASWLFSDSWLLEIQLLWNNARLALPPWCVAFGPLLCFD